MTPTPWPKLAFAQRSDPGRDPAKQVNEDAAHYQETPLGHLLVVCDGMGGHASGREASNLAIATIAREVSAAPPTSNPGEVLRNAIVNAGRQVFSLGGIDNNPSRPGSTCVAVLVHPGGTEVAHIGDSRAYLLRKGQLWPLTRDHSMVQQMVDAGLLRPEEAATHPDSNKITRALGMRPDSDVELRLEPMLQEPRDLFLLITDGVSDVVPDSDLHAMASAAVESGNVEQFCEQLIALANSRGGPDNCTVQAALIVEPGLDAEKVRLRAPAPTQVDLAGPAGLALDFGTPVPTGPLPAAPAQPAAPAPAAGRGPQRTMPLATVPADLGAAPRPSPAPQPAPQPPFAAAPQPAAAFGAAPPAAAFGAAPQPGAAFNAGAAPAEAPPAAGPPAGGGRARVAGGTIPFALTPAAGMPAAGSPGVGIIVPPGAAPPGAAPPGAAPPGGAQAGMSPAATPQPAPAPAQPVAAPAAPTRRWGWVVFGVVLFLVGAALVAGIVWYIENEDEEPPALPDAPAASESGTMPSEPVPAAPPPYVPIPHATPTHHPHPRPPHSVPAPPAPTVLPSIRVSPPPKPPPTPPTAIVPAPPPPKTAPPPGPVVPAPPPTR
ncbi:MAG TPA: protein phosphatase 2C domain-containing protein [Polyangiaceae bacterium]|nr:protein phosphatase 2C domain-containing protein [Polyangiaceae bacterium]